MSSFIGTDYEVQLVDEDVDVVLNFVFVGYSPEYPKSKLSVELDTAKATWVANDTALISTKTGMLLFLSLVVEGR